MFLYSLLALAVVTALIFAAPLKAKVWATLAVVAAGALWASATAVGVLAGGHTVRLWATDVFLFGSDAGSMDPLSALFALIVARPIIHLRGDYLLIVTIGIVEIVRIALINDVFGLTGGANGIFGIARPELFGIKIRKAIQFYYLIWIMVGFTVLLFHWLSESRFGRALNCIKEDDTAAEGCGMDVAHLKLMAFVIGAFWAGMAGNLFAAKMTIISPSSFTFWESVVVFAVVILSGGSQIGVLLGTFLIVALPEMFRDFASARMLVFGLAMMIMMVVRPQGLLPPSPRRYDVRRLLRRTRDFSSPVAPRTARKEGAA